MNVDFLAVSWTLRPLRDETIVLLHAFLSSHSTTALCPRSFLAPFASAPPFGLGIDDFLEPVRSVSIPKSRNWKTLNPVFLD